MEKQQQSPILIYGLIGGIATIVLMLLLYIVDADMLNNFSTLIINQIVVVVFMILAANEARKRNYGIIDFKTALKNSYGTAALALLIFVLFYVILYKYIDPNLITAYKKKSIERAVEFMTKQNMTKTQIDNAIAEAQKQDYSPSVKITTFIYAGYAILSFFYALTISAIMALAFKGNKSDQLIEENN